MLILTIILAMNLLLSISTLVRIYLLSRTMDMFSHSLIDVLEYMVDRSKNNLDSIKKSKINEGGKMSNEDNEDDNKKIERRKFIRKNERRYKN